MTTDEALDELRLAICRAGIFVTRVRMRSTNTQPGHVQLRCWADISSVSHADVIALAALLRTNDIEFRFEAETQEDELGGNFSTLGATILATGATLPGGDQQAGADRA